MRETDGVPPAALRTECDGHQLLCHHCVSDGNHREADSGTMEITGYNLEDGSFATINPPLYLDLTEVPMVDGTYDINFITAKIEERVKADAAASKAKARKKK